MAILKSKKRKMEENGFTVNKNMKQQKQIQVKQDYVKLKQIKIPQTL